jgi:hypothetical protein
VVVKVDFIHFLHLNPNTEKKKKTGCAITEPEIGAFMASTRLIIYQSCRRA